MGIDIGVYGSENGGKGGIWVKKGGIWLSSDPGLQGNHRSGNWPKDEVEIQPNCWNCILSIHGAEIRNHENEIIAEMGVKSKK